MAIVPRTLTLSIQFLFALLVGYAVPQEQQSASLTLST